MVVCLYRLVGEKEMMRIDCYGEFGYCIGFAIVQFGLFYFGSMNSLLPVCIVSLELDVMICIVKTKE